MVADNRLIRRCTKCRHEQSTVLPEVEKKVLYLDQLALSEIFKIEMGTMKADAPHRAFWQSAHAKIRRVVLLQQAIFPDSDIHLDETIVFKAADEFRQAYKRLSGGASLIESDQVALMQLAAFVDGYLNGKAPPAIEFGVDGVLHGRRNAWLPDIVIFVNADYSTFADGIRTARESTSKAFAEVAERWAREKRPFAEVLLSELESFGHANKQALLQALTNALKGMQTGHLDSVLSGGMHPTFRQFLQAKGKFEEAGYSSDDAAKEVFKFWEWPGLQEVPSHRIAAYLYAALARKMGAGQRRPPSRGMMNDIKAISTYAPYVDAMFLDNECAALLAEEPLRSDLRYKAQIFSLNSGGGFLAYLDEIERAASAEVRAFAAEIYGLAPVT